MNLEQTSAKHAAKAPESRTGEAAQEVFPGVRYFQVHFEHIEALIAELRASLEQVRGELAEVRALATSGEDNQGHGQVALCPDETTGQRRSN